MKRGRRKRNRGGKILFQRGKPQQAEAAQELPQEGTHDKPYTP